MTVRVGIDASIDDGILTDFTDKATLVRIPEDPQGELEIDFWVPGMPPRIMQKQLPHLKGIQVIQALWAGVDALLKIIPPGVTLCDARGVHDIPTAEWAVAAILAMQKHFPFYFEFQQKGSWATGQQTKQIDAPSQTKIKPPPLTEEVADTTILIVGYGFIGKAIEARLAPFGVNFLRVARNAHEGVEPVSKLDELLGKADIVVLIIPLTSETRHLIDAQRLAKMKPRALLVNAARGPIVETEALLQALNDNRIRAAIDVTDPEPLPAGHPLWKAPNLLLTPHVAGDSTKFMRRAFKLVSEQAERYARGEPLLNVVTGEY
jgi:phosphoglycerate dehydrogenase-like enzyme